MSEEIAVQVAELQEATIKTQDLLENYIEKSNGQIKESGGVQEETKSAVEAVSASMIEMTDRCVELEQKVAEIDHGTKARSDGTVDLGKALVDSDEFKEYADGKREKARISVKTAIINATGQNQPLVPSDRLAGIIHEPNRVLRMRDVMSVGQTSSNLIEYAKENVFTNNAGAQISGSPEAFENVTKPESAITFTLSSEPVSTIAHWIPISKQVLSDSPMLASYVNSRLMYGLKLKEDTEILLGTSANGRISGVYDGRTAYTMDSPLDYTTKLDVLRDAIGQCHASEYRPNAIVLNSADWAAIELQKDTTNAYIFANPQAAANPVLWGLPVVITNSLTSGVFLVGAFDMACQLWDREEATIEVGLNSTNFVDNMVTVLAEERLALTIYRAAGLVGGSFTVT